MDESNFKERRSEIEIRERLIRVEEAAKASTELAKIVSDKVDENQDILQGLVLTAEKQKSFIGAVVLIVSSLWAVLIFAKDWLVDHLK